MELPSPSTAHASYDARPLYARESSHRINQGYPPRQWISRHTTDDVSLQEGQEAIVCPCHGPVLNHERHQACVEMYRLYRRVEGQQRQSRVPRLGLPEGAFQWIRTWMKNEETPHATASPISPQTTAEPLPKIISLRLFEHTVSFLASNCRDMTHYKTLCDLHLLDVRDLNSSDAVTVLVRIGSYWSNTVDLTRLVTELRCNELPSFHEALRADAAATLTFLQNALKPEKAEVFTLVGDEANAFSNLIDSILYRGTSSSVSGNVALFGALESLPNDVRRTLHHTSVRLVEKSLRIPSRLYLAGVTRQSSVAVARGGYGEVSKATYGGVDVAVKTFHGHTNIGIKQYYREIVLHRGLEHGNICPVLGVEAANSSISPRVNLVMPWMSFGNVDNFLTEEGWSTELGTRLCLETLHGLAYLHSMDIIHGDLHAANILIDIEKRVRLADFGLANLADRSEVSRSMGIPGALRYMAPEILAPDLVKKAHPEHTRESDIFSFGQVCWKIFTGLKPFPKFVTDAQVHRATTPDNSARFHQPRTLSPRDIPDVLWDIMQSCWNFRAAERPLTSGENDLSRWCRGGVVAP